MRLSIVVPIYNEQGNVRLLHDSLVKVLSPLGETYEMIFVNDGSHDGSAVELQHVAAQDPAVQDRALSPQLRPDGGDAGRH